MGMRHSISLAVAWSAGLVGAAQATLIDRGNGLIYDNVLNITWLQDANLAATDTFGLGGIDANGRMTWNTAESWIAAMDAADYKGYNNWRLPTIAPVNGTNFVDTFSNNGTTDFGYGITSPNSELAYLYYVDLGNLGYCTPNAGGSNTCIQPPISGLTNTGPFTSLAPYVYWSGTQDANNVSVFNMSEGAQYPGVASSQYPLRRSISRTPERESAFLWLFRWSA